MVLPPSWLCCLVLCSSSVALAQTVAPGVMPFPLEMKRTPAGLAQEDRDALQREYTRLLRRAGARIPDFTRYDLALKELKRQDCEREDECLAQLAKKAESLYALYASLDYTVEGAVWVSGRVVRDDGKVARATQLVKVKEGEFKEDAMKALGQLFDALKIGELPPERPVETKAPEVIAVAPPVTVRTLVDPGVAQRATGRTLVVAGAVVAVAGGVTFGVGQTMGGGLTPDANRNLPLDQLPSYQSARSLSTAGLIGAAVGGATALAGALIWGLAPSAPVTVSAMAGPTGATVSVQGAF